MHKVDFSVVSNSNRTREYKALKKQKAQRPCATAGIKLKAVASVRPGIIGFGRNCPVRIFFAAAPAQGD